MLRVVMCQVPSETVYSYQTGLPGAAQLLSRISCTRSSMPSHSYWASDSTIDQCLSASTGLDRKEP